MTRLVNGLMRYGRRVALGVAVTATAAALVSPHAFASPEGDAAGAINAAWNAAGGSSSPVGGSDGDVYEVGTGYGQKFTEGQIFYTPDTGAHLIYGDILNKYQSLGGPGDSDLGFPTIDEVAGLVGPNSRVSTFSASDKPAIFWTSDTGAWVVRGALNLAWDKLGGSAGVLGVPTTDERYNGDVVSQTFTGGELSWNTATKTFTSDPSSLADGLAGLEVPTDPTTQINLAWRASGGLGGPLGARQGAQSTIGDPGPAQGAEQGYAGGKIFYSPDTGAHAVTGAILSKYESLNGPTGDLGYPIGTESEGGVPNSRIGSFSAPDKPVIFWTPDSGAIVIRGAINAAWQKLGGATGTLGAPTGEQTSSGDTVSQTFSGGQVSWNQATKEFSTNPADLASSLSGIELPDGVGQTPATGTTGSSGKGSKQWWWLAIAIPLLLLVGLLGLWAMRRGGSAASDRDFDYDGEEGRWPGERLGGASEEERTAEYRWSARTFEDEDKIDTAPTRIPRESDFDGFSAGFDESDGERSDSGRHATDATGSESQWQLDLGEVGEPRRRHAAQDFSRWTQPFESRFDDVADAPAEGASGGFDEPSWTGYSFDSKVAVEVEAEVEPQAEESEPWRPAIHLPLADPYQAPDGYVIKANTHSGLYYTPESALYDNTVPEVWFASEELAQANGFIKAPK